MKPSRNEPCPCGSGKKYKKCCYLTEQNNTDLLMDTQEQKDAIEEQEFYIRIMSSLRKFTLDRKPHIKKYYKIRKMHSDIVDAMIQYHDDGKFERRLDSNVVPKKPSKNIHLIESSFDLETRVGGQAFYDLLLYKSTPNMSCITEDFIRNHRYRKPEKIEFLHSMLDSKLGLFEITGTDIGEGYAYIREIFTGAEYTLIDIGISGELYYDEFYIYTRIITYNGISFGTGLSMVFTKTDPFIQSHIRQHKQDYTPGGEFLRFTQLYNNYSRQPDRVRTVQTQK